MIACSFAITFNKDQVLLVKLGSIYAYANHWSFPGGVVDYGESLQHSAKREVLEETGISVEIGQHVTTFVSNKNEISMYLAQYISGDITPQTSEISDAGWFDLNDALSLPLAYNVRDILLGIKK